VEPERRAQGARGKTTLGRETLLDGEVEGFTREAIDVFKGDVTAVCFCLDRSSPVCRDRHVALEAPEFRWDLCQL
jgi:hypothetical protein